MAWETVYTPDTPGGAVAPDQQDDRPWAEKAKDTAAYYEKMLRLSLNAGTLGMADRFAAGGEALTGGAPSYADALKKERDLSETIARENPQMAVAAEVVGSAAGGAGLARLGLTTAGRMAGQPLLRRSAAAAVEGATLGAAQGAGQTYTGNPMDYVSNAGKGAAIGGVLGFPAPAVGAVAGAGAKKLMDQGYFGSVPGALATAAQSDVVGMRTLPRRGDRAMLVDAGPSMKGLAQGAVLPEKGGGGAMGPGQAALERNLTARDESMPRTITNETNQIFGRAETPSRVEEGVRGRMRLIGPEYDTLLNGPNVRAIDNSALARRLEALAINEKGETRQVLSEVRGMLDINTNPGHLDPHPRAMHATREEVRGMMNDPKYNDTTRGRLAEIYTDLTQEIQRKVPGIRELDSRYAELGTQAEAVTTASPGSRAFIKDRVGVVRPDEMQDVMTEAAQPKGVNIGPSAEPVRLRQATRAELDRIVGTNKNDLLALENALGRPGDYNIDKLAIIFGRERASRMMEVLENERVFRKSFQDIVQNSQTAKRQASADALDSSTGKIPLDAGMTGTVLRSAQWVKDKMMATSAASNRDRIAQILSTNNPQEVSSLVQRLLAAEPDRARRAEIVRNLVQSGWTGGGAGMVPGAIRR